MASTVFDNEEFFDIRDMIDRVEELRAARDGWVSGAPDGSETFDPEGWRRDEPDDADELDTLEAFLMEVAGTGGDHEWEDAWYPVTFHREDKFRDYAEEFAADVYGKEISNSRWPFSHIDWDAAADALREDYSESVLNGTTYLAR